MNHLPNTSFTIEIDGRTVHGVITERWERVIEVRLESPFGRAGLSSAWVTPLFAWARAVERGRADGYLSPSGDNAAAQLLEELYRKAVLFDRHRNELRRRLDAYEARLRALDEENPELQLRERRSDARRRFRSGMIGQVEYQRIRKELRAIQKEFDDRRWALERAFMDEPAPWADEFPDVDLGQVRCFLEG